LSAGIAQFAASGLMNPAKAITANSRILRPALFRFTLTEEFGWPLLNRKSLGSEWRFVALIGCSFVTSKLDTLNVEVAK
jgi:hypothetical protein